MNDLNGTFINCEENSNWGGKRQNAGRKKGESTKKTKVVRVPEEIDIQKLLSLREDFKSLVHAWKLEVHPTSPRDESARILLEEIEKLLE